MCGFFIFYWLALERIHGGMEARIQFDGLSPLDDASCVCPAWARCKRGSSPLWKYQK